MQQRERRTVAIAQRVADFGALTDAVRVALAEDHFSAAAGLFREAVNVSCGVEELEEAVVGMAIEIASDWMADLSRLARSFLHDAAEVDLQQRIPRALWQRIEEQERDEAIRSAVMAAEGVSTKAMLPPIRQRLMVLANRYPGDARLQTRLKALNEMAALQTDSERRADEKKRVRAAEENRVLARAAWARAREFQKGGFREEALEELQRLRELEPSFPGLDEEIRRCVGDPVPAREKYEPEPVAGRQRIRTAAARVFFAAASLSAAMGLIWVNRSEFMVSKAVMQARPVVRDSSQKPSAAKVVSADERAWLAVDPKNADQVEQYLDRFPSGENRGLAVEALSNIRIQHRQVAEVRDVLRQYEAAWNARNVDSILSIQHDLDRRSLQAQLSPLKSMVMNLSPASSPRFEGDQATIRCLRTISEVYEGGGEKRSAEQAVTFVLARRDGGWIIQSARQ